MLRKKNNNVFSCEINILLKNKIFIDLQKEEEKEKKELER
jgi:hypothetical protein